jgi:AcrR family transcriptional regulator
MRDDGAMTNAAQDDRRRALAVTGDPRAARTRDRVVDAVDALLEARESVTVAAVCARAGIARSTFYTHFATIEDVVVHVVDTMFDELGPRDVTRRTEHTMGRAAITRIGLTELLGAFRDRQHWFLHALSAPATERVRSRLVEEMSTSLRGTILAERPGATNAFIHTASGYIAGGVLTVLLGWLNEQQRPTDQQVVDALAQLLPTWLSTDE